MVDPIKPNSDRCLGLLELSSVPLGCVVVDAMLKGAPLQLLFARAVTPGKYVALIEGDVQSVRSGLDSGVAIAGDGLIGELFLPQPHAHLIEGIVAPRSVESPDAVGILQTASISSVLVAADGGLKTGEVSLIELRLAMGLGGQAFFTLTGELSSVEAAIERASELAGEALIEARLIPNPDDALMSELIHPRTPFSELYDT